MYLPEEDIRHAFGIDSAIDYVHENPVKAGVVDRSESYPNSSAVDFAGGKGLVNVEPC